MSCVSSGLSDAHNVWFLVIVGCFKMFSKSSLTELLQKKAESSMGCFTTAAESEGLTPSAQITGRYHCTHPLIAVNNLVNDSETSLEEHKL